MAFNANKKKKVDRLLLDILTDKNVDGQEILATVVMMKESAFRELFLESMYSKAPGYLSLPSFMLIVDFIRVILRESNNVYDFKSMARAYTLSSLYSVKCEGIAISIKSALRYHEAWCNTEFWVNCTDELIARDIDRWMTCHSSLSFDLLAMEDQHVYGIFAINRIQAILISMQSVGIHEEHDVRKEFLLSMIEHFHLSSKGDINI
jgi:hypothetical protein